MRDRDKQEVNNPDQIMSNKKIELADSRKGSCYQQVAVEQSITALDGATTQDTYEVALKYVKLRKHFLMRSA